MQSEFCNLCLVSCDNFSEPIEEDVRESLAQLLQHLDIKMGRASQVACRACSTRLKRYLEFKSSFMQTQACVQSFGGQESGGLLDLRQMYLQNEGHGSEVTSKDLVVCRFCLKQATGAYVALLEDRKELSLVTIMIRQCFPGLELGTMSGYVICVPCHELLDASYNFVRSLYVENCIKVEDAVEEMDVNEGLDLKPMLFVSAELLNGNGCANLIAVKEEKDWLMSNGYYLEGAVEANEEGGLEQEDKPALDKKRKVEIEAVQIDGKRIQDAYDGSRQVVDITMKDIVREEGSLSSFEGKICDVKVEHTANERNLDVYDESKADIIKEEVLEVDEHSLRLFDDDGCDVKVEQTANESKASAKKRQTPSEVAMYKCETCLYETRHKAYYNRHTLVHMKPSAITIFKCETCFFETRHKLHYNRHILLHKTPSKVSMFKCEICLYETRQKSNYNRHILIHKQPFEVAIFKCETCLYETRDKSHYNRHILIHKTASEVSMFKCETCLYETRQKSNYNRHILIHKKPSEVTMYKCERCVFETKSKSNLDQHMLIHKNPSEVPLYKCETCLFETKSKKSLGLHNLAHKKPSEVTVYKCETCLFKSRHKSSYNRHVLTHKRTSECL